MAFKKILFCFFLIILITAAGSAQAFIGPAAGQSPGTGGGAIFVDSSGHIGIGTATPSNTLDIQGSGVMGIDVNSTNSNTQFRLQYNGATEWTIFNAPSNNEIWFNNAAGSTKFLIQQGGNVGIGTSTPGQALDVNGNIRTNGSLMGAFAGNISAANITGPSAFGSNYGTYNYALPGAVAIGTTTVVGLPSNGLYVAGSVGIGTRSPGQTLTVVGSSMALTGPGSNISSFIINTGTGGHSWRWIASNSGDLLIGGFGLYDDTSSTYRLSVLTSGNVGIGTVSPLSLLHVNGFGAEISLQDTGAGGTRWGLLSRRAGTAGLFSIYDFTHARDILVGDTNGNVGIGTASPAAMLDVRGEIRSGNGTVNNVLSYSSGVGVVGTLSNHPLQFYTNNGARVTIDTVGEVGIGTTNPGASLDVRGQIIGGFGAMGTGGVLNWNDPSNARPGNGYTLLMGNAANGPGPASYFHSFSFEYAQKDGTGNITQLAIPYASPSNAGLYIRGRYSGVWSSWSQVGGSSAWADITGKPTTVGGYGITDFIIGGRSSADLNTYLTSGMYGLNSTPPNSPVSWGSVISANNSDTGLQIAGGYQSDNLYFRGWWSSGAGFSAWRTLIHSGNIGSQSVANATNVSGGTVNALNYLQVNGKYAIDGTDSYLRLNQQNSFTSGVYTPYNLRADGVVYAGGSTYYISGGASYLNTLILGGGSSSNWATVNIGGGSGLNVAGSIYSYNSVCVGNGWGTCNGPSGVVLGLTNASAYTNLPSSGASIIGGNLSLAGGTGKLTVGTVDPVYTINGIHYATYSPESIGLKVQTAGSVDLKSGKAIISFADASNGSDLWLFTKTTNLLNGSLADVTVLLTPSFDGKTWYEKDDSKKTITIYGDSDGEVSYQLIGPRFDSSKWSNYSQDNIEGFNLDALLK